LRVRDFWRCVRRLKACGDESRSVSKTPDIYDVRCPNGFISLRYISLHLMYLGQ
jgi:hypothetical protein